MLRTPIDRMGAQRKQWDDGDNFLAVSPGVILGYEGNTTTNRYLIEEGIEIIPVVAPSSDAVAADTMHDLSHRVRNSGLT